MAQVPEFKAVIACVRRLDDQRGYYMSDLGASTEEEVRAALIAACATA